jgi:hypothetical protein
LALGSQERIHVGRLDVGELSGGLFPVPDQMLPAGTSLRIVAKRFGTSTTSLHRHKQHISKILVKANDIAAIAKANTLLDQVRNLLSQAERLMGQAERAGSLDTGLRGIGHVRSVLQLLGEVSGQLAGKGMQIAIGINGGPAVPNFRAMTDDELRPALRRSGTRCHSYRVKSPGGT